MVDEEYWHSRRRRLTDPKWGPLAFVPMEDAALLGGGPQLAVSAAFEFLLLDMPSEANTMLEFVPRLRSALQLPHALFAFPEHRRRELAAYLREYLLLGLWLSNGEIDPAVAEEAYDHLVALNRW